MDSNFEILQLSSLGKTWIIDIDGTIFKHNGHLYNNDELLDGVTEFFTSISDSDWILLITAREEVYRTQLEEKLKESNIRWNLLIMGVPKGERVLINDIKPSGLKTAIALNVQRDMGLPSPLFIIKDSN